MKSDAWFRGDKHRRLMLKARMEWDAKKQAAHDEERQRSAKWRRSDAWFHGDEHKRLMLKARTDWEQKKQAANRADQRLLVKTWGDDEIDAQGENNVGFGGGALSVMNRPELRHWDKDTQPRLDDQAIAAYNELDGLPGHMSMPATTWHVSVTQVNIIQYEERGEELCDVHFAINGTDALTVALRRPIPTSVATTDSNAASLIASSESLCWHAASDPWMKYLFVRDDLLAYARFARDTFEENGKAESDVGLARLGRLQLEL